MSIFNTSSIKLLILLQTIMLSLQADKHCLGATANNKCTVCAYGVPNSEGKCEKPSSKINGCYLYSSKTVCAECQEGYYKNPNPTSANSTCIELDESIRQYCRYSTISAKLCSHCDYGVLSDAGYCFPLNTCSDPRCDACYLDSNGQEQCYDCWEDHMLWTSVTPALCLPSSNLTNCHSTSNWLACGRCKSGYYWWDNKCKKTKKTRHGSASKMSVITAMLLLLGLMKH